MKMSNILDSTVQTDSASDYNSGSDDVLDSSRTSITHRGVVLDKKSKEYKNLYQKKYYRENKDNIIRISMKSQNKIKDSNRFRCEEHDISYPSNSRLQRHLRGYKHNPKKYVIYICHLCNFSSKQKYNYSTHLKSMRHKYNYLVFENKNRDENLSDEFDGVADLSVELG